MILELKSRILYIYYSSKLWLLNVSKKYRFRGKPDSNSEEQFEQRRKNNLHVPLPSPEVAKSNVLHLPKAKNIKEAQRCRHPECYGRTR